MYPPYVNTNLLKPLLTQCSPSYVEKKIKTKHQPKTYAERYQNFPYSFESFERTRKRNVSPPVSYCKCKQIFLPVKYRLLGSSSNLRSPLFPKPVRCKIETRSSLNLCIFHLRGWKGRDISLRETCSFHCSSSVFNK